MSATTGDRPSNADLAAIDIASPEIYETGIPHEGFATLRAYDPVHWHRWDWSGGGFWAVTTLTDITTVTRDHETYTSEEHVNLWELTPQAQEARRSLIETDGDRHKRLRGLVAAPFSMRAMANYVEVTQSILSGLLDRIVDGGELDLVSMLSEPYPIRVIVSVLGIPQADGDFLVELSNQLVEGTSNRVLDPHAYGNTTPLELLPFNSPAAHALFEFGRSLGAERRSHHGDDLVSKLINGEIDGDRLTDAEFCNFFQLLVFAGNETTRTAISNGLLCFMQNPNQLSLLQARPELIPNAVEEIIRHATPVLHMRRTATKDTALNGTVIAKGDKVVMWYASGNFDEAAFPEPLRFDITRPLKPQHGAFGAQGRHHCLGAPLARLEIKLLLEELVRRRVAVMSTSPATRVRSNFVNGILALPGRIDSI
jgi:cytochrome P450